MYKKILIPTDGSPLSTEAAHAGIALARHLGAEIVGITVVPEYQYPLFLDMVPLDYPDPVEQKAARQKTGENYLKEIEKAATDAGLKFTGITTTSDATAQQIVATAEAQHCDLIFMGSHGRSGLSKLLLGSVTAKVLAIGQIPVLTYRSKQEA